MNGKSIKKALIILSSVAVLTSLSTAAFAGATTQTDKELKIEKHLSPKQKHIKNLIFQVKPLVKTNQDGTNTVSLDDLNSLKLSKDDVKFILNSIDKYNKLVIDKKVNAITHRVIDPQILKKHVEEIRKSTNIQLSPYSTDGISSSWFTQDTPSVQEFGYWWGDEDVWNEKATSKLEGAINEVAGGSATVAVAAASLPFVGEAVSIISGAIAGLGTGAAGLLQNEDNGYGDYIDYAGDYVPFYTGANSN